MNEDAKRSCEMIAICRGDQSVSCTDSPGRCNAGTEGYEMHVPGHIETWQVQTLRGSKGCEKQLQEPGVQSTGTKWER